MPARLLNVSPAFDAASRKITVELELSNKLSEMRGGITLQKSRWDVPDPDFASVFFFRTPDVYGYFRVSTEITSQLEILFSGNYTGSMRVPHYAGFISRDRLERSKTFSGWSP
jgi:outer membrane receptor for ferrienterochelin and colicins